MRLCSPLGNRSGGSIRTTSDKPDCSIAGSKLLDELSPGTIATTTTTTSVTYMYASLQ